MKSKLIALGLVGGCALLLGSSVAFAAEGVNSFESKDGSIPVRLGSSARKGCVWGDLDAIKMELNKSSKKTLLVTLEPMIGVTGEKGEAKGIQTKEISGVDFEKGYTTKFDAPDKPAVLALYVCKDSAKDGKCSGKPSTPLDQVLQQHLSLGTPASDKVNKDSKVEDATAPTLKGEPIDRIYYFAVLLYNKGKIETLKSGGDPASFDAFLKSAEAAGIKDAQAIIDVAKAKNTALRSIQPEISATAISVNLPRINKGVCKR